MDVPAGGVKSLPRFGLGASRSRQDPARRPDGPTRRVSFFALAMAAALAVSAHAQPVPTLQIVHANSGTTSGLAPVCTAGVPDALNRGCTGASESGVPASAGTVITGDGHATHPEIGRAHV